MSYQRDAQPINNRLVSASRPWAAPQKRAAQ